MENNIVEYEIRGIALIETKEGVIGSVAMSISHSHKDLTNPKTCFQFINDNGYGCKRILAAFVSVYKVYNNGYKLFWYEENFNTVNPNKTIPQRYEEMLKDACVIYSF